MYRVLNLKDVDLRNSVAIVGFPGMGLVGKSTADFFIKNFSSELVTRVVGYGFPSQLIVSHGIGSLITLDMYYTEADGKKLVVITSATQPTNHWEQHELAEVMVRELSDRGVSMLLAAAAFVGDVVTESKRRRVYVAASSEEFMEKLRVFGAIPISDGVISGLNGIVVGWAHMYGIEAACILGETWRSIVDMGLADYRAAKAVIEFIAKFLGIEVDTSELDRQADEVEENIRKLYSEWIAKSKERKEVHERRELPYTM